MTAANGVDAEKQFGEGATSDKKSYCRWRH